MSDQRLKIAVFIDFDNVEIGVKTTLGRQFDVGAVLEAVKERGEIITKVAYGDWKRAGDHSRAMAQHAVRLVQRVMTPGGDKNGADINLALDALEMAFTHHHINAFVIVGGDSDFITLVEKLKQYDKKVFVIGGRAFTSQVMQKNCTEFIAYENVASSAGMAVPDRPRIVARNDRARPGQSSTLDQVLPLVQRALKVLADREVSPQLGLLKSTLLQLDSSFSERDYGASTFRDFAEKLEEQGLVTLKHLGRTTIVELGGSERPESAQERVSALNESVGAATAETTEGPADSGDASVSHDGFGGDGSDVAAEPGGPSRLPMSSEPVVSELSLADGVALVRAVLAEASTPPRWPMYLRQMKQFLRTARPDFDERRYGSLQDLLRACQKDGLVRLERDRQGGLRAFAGSAKPTNVPHGWASGASADPSAADAMPDVDGNGNGSSNGDEGFEPQPDTPIEAQFELKQDAPSPPAAESDRSADADADADAPSEPDDQLAMFGAVSPTDPEPKSKRPRRARKEGDGDPAATRPRRARKAPPTRVPARRSRS